MKTLQAGELVKTLAGTYALIVGGISSTERKERGKMEIFPQFFNRGKIEHYPLAKLQKIKSLTQEEEQVKEELVKRFNSYMWEKVRNKGCEK